MNSNLAFAAEVTEGGAVLLQNSMGTEHPAAEVPLLQVCEWAVPASKRYAVPVVASAAAS